MTKQLNIGIGHQNFFCLNIGTSDIGRFTWIGRSLMVSRSSAILWQPFFHIR